MPLPPQASIQTPECLSAWEEGKRGYNINGTTIVAVVCDTASGCIETFTAVGVVTGTKR